MYWIELKYQCKCRTHGQALHNAQYLHALKVLRRHSEKSVCRDRDFGPLLDNGWHMILTLEFFIWYFLCDNCLTRITQMTISYLKISTVESFSCVPNWTDIYSLFVQFILSFFSFDVSLYFVNHFNCSYTSTVICQIEIKCLRAHWKDTAAGGKQSVVVTLTLYIV